MRGLCCWGVLWGPSVPLLYTGWWKDQGDIGTSIPILALVQWLWNGLRIPEGASRKAPK